MATAAISIKIKSTFFHPEHLLTRYRYSEASTYSCAACERTVTGAGYSCDQCAGFDIHEACLSLPLLVNFDGHPAHKLTLTRLRGSRWCDVCKETSVAGRYMYLCSPCNYDVHPRCTSLVAAQQQQQQQQQQQHDETRRGSGGVIRTVIKVGVFGFRVVDLFTGGLMSPVLDVIDAAVGN